MQNETVAEMKRRVRQLKKMEQRVRGAECSTLLWDSYFCLREDDNQRAKYALSYLLSVDKHTYKQIVDEFLFHVYYEHYKADPAAGRLPFDPAILCQLGLPYDADESAVKRKFRELAKKYHPDAGGDHGRFIELVDQYERLTKPL